MDTQCTRSATVRWQINISWVSISFRLIFVYTFLFLFFASKNIAHCLNSCWIHHLDIVVPFAPRRCLICLTNGGCWMRRCDFSFMLFRYFPWSFGHYTVRQIICCNWSVFSYLYSVQKTCHMELPLVKCFLGKKLFLHSQI